MCPDSIELETTHFEAQLPRFNRVLTTIVIIGYRNLAILLLGVCSGRASLLGGLDSCPRKVKSSKGRGGRTLDER